MILPIIALLLFGAPTTAQNKVTGSEITSVAPQKEKTIPIDINNDKGLKAKFPDAVKFYALQVEVTVGEGVRALSSEKQGTESVDDLLTQCAKPEQIEEYAVKEVSLAHFYALTYSRVIIEVTELAYLNNKGELVRPSKRYFYTTSVKV